MTTIEWINHASFTVRSGRTALVCDPWLFGTAFNDGWDLVAPSQHTPPDIAKAGNVWFSHVHPDHFAPRVLKAMSKQERRSTQVYFQRTSDQQVAKFCRGIGFPVTEVGNGQTVSIGPDFRLTVGRVPFYDSWALIETADARILNLNDCVLNRPRDLRRLADRVGRIDVLLTQFSYANWIGGSGDIELRVQAAAEKLDWMRMQLAVLQPAACIPFASFVWFSHADNVYLNDCRNHVEDAVHVIEAAGARPVVLFPGQTWQVGEAHDPVPAIKRYEQQWDPGTRTLHDSPTIDWEELTYLADACVRRLSKRNNRIWLRVAARLGIGAPIAIRITDLGRTACFDPLRGLSASTATPDISLGSQSLAYTLKFDWGADTLSVNGRFQATPAGYRKMLRTFGPPLLNNNGRVLGFRLLADPWLVRRAIDRFIFRAS
jgi:UDP-MurNAc hydroxylase